jgi:hypothetical protein
MQSNPNNEPKRKNNDECSLYVQFIFRVFRVCLCGIPPNK